MKTNPRVLISGGGTGGHIFPAIAIGKAIQAKYPDAVIEFVGAKDKMEMQKVPDAGFKIHGLWISGIQRKLTAKNLSFPFKLLSSLWNARKIVRKFKPDVAVGVGGFASGPLLQACNWKGVPTLVQEQNSYPGITNKLLASKAAKICVAFDNMERFFPKDKIVITGNPVRKDILDRSIDKGSARASFGLEKEKRTLLIIGGSLGARTINQAVEHGLSKIEQSDIQILWQTGRYYEGQPEVVGHRTTFITDMASAYASADIVISRAGALSISELCVQGKACILVPSPNVSEDHQTKNALALVEKKAALLVKDRDAQKNLIDTALELIHDENRIGELEKNALSLGETQATTKILEQIEILINR